MKKQKDMVEWVTEIVGSVIIVGIGVAVFASIVRYIIWLFWEI